MQLLLDMSWDGLNPELHRSIGTGHARSSAAFGPPRTCRLHRHLGPLPAAARRADDPDSAVELVRLCTS